ncbi:hypothetical protein RRG08_050883 [Elysia crispata]|uniref:DUF19 domain-containing protein n=1 Tax=Elysia crispata TaxID=231223 RepID=A0AAE0ZEK4_9GAST|nr:hypothetical protein RRG08_050883 [Elysia crispata]
MIWWFLVVLSCLQLLATGTSVSKCPSLFQCERPIRDERFFADDHDSMIFKIADVNLLNRVCGKLPDLRSCVIANTASCSDEDARTDTTFFKDVMDYICTPSGRTVALATHKASCTIDQKLDTLFLDTMFICNLFFKYDIEDEEISKGKKLTIAEKCPFKHTLDTCVVSFMSNKCGPEMGNLMEKMWDIWSTHQFPEFITSCVKDKAATR